MTYIIVKMATIDVHVEPLKNILIHSVKMGHKHTSGHMTYSRSMQDTEQRHQCCPVVGPTRIKVRVAIGTKDFLLKFEG